MVITLFSILITRGNYNGEAKPFIKKKKKKKKKEVKKDKKISFIYWIIVQWFGKEINYNILPKIQSKKAKYMALVINTI